MSLLDRRDTLAHPLGLGLVVEVLVKLNYDMSFEVVSLILETCDCKGLCRISELVLESEICSIEAELLS